MGPTNVALVKLFRVDQQLRQSQERLDAATKDIRVQQRKINDLSEKHVSTSATLKQTLAKQGQAELEIKSRNAHIEKLRTQQQSARNDREYKAFIAEINAAKAEIARLEEQAVAYMESAEKLKTEDSALVEMLAREQEKLTTMQAALEGTVKELTAEIDQIRPVREEAAKAVPSRALAIFERLTDHFDGTAVAALSRPHPDEEEYHCSECHMDLIVDVYNRLRLRDEILQCASCQRILFIPDDLHPVQAAKSKTTRTRKAATPKSSTARSKKSSGKSSVSEPMTPDELIKSLLTKAQGESVQRAKDADHKPVEFDVLVSGSVVGSYKGQTPEHFQQVSKFFFEEAKLGVEIEVRRKSAEPAAETPEANQASAGTETDVSSAAPAGV